jgi:bacterial/archaeal transporter family-2 protein
MILNRAERMLARRYLLPGKGEGFIFLVAGFSVGAVALGVAALVVQRSLPDSVASAPWWAWTGGLLGALFVLASIILTPRLGAATTIGLILTGQVLASIVIDHFGLIRVPVHEASFPRIIGALLIVAGVVMVQRF